MKLSEKKILELKEIAKNKNLKCYSKLRKDELIELIQSSTSIKTKSKKGGAGPIPPIISFYIFNKDSTLNKVIELKINFSCNSKKITIDNILKNIASDTKKYSFLMLLEQILKNEKGTFIFDKSGEIMGSKSFMNLEINYNIVDGNTKDINKLRETNPIFVGFNIVPYDKLLKPRNEYNLILINYGINIGNDIFNKYIKQSSSICPNPSSVSPNKQKYCDQKIIIKFNNIEHILTTYDINLKQSTILDKDNKYYEEYKKLNSQKGNTNKLNSQQGNTNKLNSQQANTNKLKLTLQKEINNLEKQIDEIVNSKKNDVIKKNKNFQEKCNKTINSPGCTSNNYALIYKNMRDQINIIQNKINKKKEELSSL
jgi:flagellar motor switch/type III secretory pathway protein FliN